MAPSRGPEVAGRAADMALVERCRRGSSARSRSCTARTPGGCSASRAGCSATRRTPKTCCRRSSSPRTGSSTAFAATSALGTWLYRLAMNQCLDHLRSRAARTSQLTDVLDDEPALLRGGRRGLAEQTRREDGHRTCARAAAGRLPRGVRAARRRRAWSTARSPRRSASRKAPRSRRCTRQGCGCVRCSAREAAASCSRDVARST